MCPWILGLPQRAPRYYGVGVRGRGGGSSWWLGRFWVMYKNGYYRFRFELSPLLIQTLVSMGFVHRGIARCLYDRPYLFVQPTSEVRRRRRSIVVVQGRLEFESKIYFVRRRIRSSGTYQQSDYRPIYNTVFIDLPYASQIADMLSDMGLSNGSYIVVDVVDPRTIAITRY